MSIEQSYHPSGEEFRRAEDSLTDEQREMTERREKDAEDEVVEALQGNGIKSEQGRNTLIRWIKVKESEAQLLNTSKANIELAISAASVYSRAGYFDVALNELRVLEGFAASEDDGFELYNKIKDLQDEILNNNRE